MMLDDDNAEGFPEKPSRLGGGLYFIQAVVDQNLGGRSPGISPGNLYSNAIRVDLTGDPDQMVRLVCDKIIPETEMKETRYAKLVQVRSKLLGDFYGRATHLRAIVWLPEVWEKEKERRFPILVNIGGFGFSVASRPFPDRPAPVSEEVPVLWVYPDASCPTGHSVFANSDNNGPWGEALVTELIPEIESRFRGIGQAPARFVTGRSSGGWATLWLMIQYPDFFGYGWSSSPDPVDFRDFQEINIYDSDANVFYGDQDRLRPLMLMYRRAGRPGSGFPVMYFKELSDFERVLRGEQLRSFEAVFSKRGSGGEPEPLWDRNTGAINPQVAEDWRRYDIGHILRTRWAELGPKLRGKVSITMGEGDNFLLEGAVKLLKEDMETLGADMRISLLPGDHFTVRTPELRRREMKAMLETFRTWQAETDTQR